MGGATPHQPPQARPPPPKARPPPPASPGPRVTPYQPSQARGHPATGLPRPGATPPRPPQARAPPHRLPRPGGHSARTPVSDPLSLLLLGGWQSHPPGLHKIAFRNDEGFGGSWRVWCKLQREGGARRGGGDRAATGAASPEPPLPPPTWQVCGGKCNHCVPTSGAAVCGGGRGAAGSFGVSPAVIRY